MIKHLVIILSFILMIISLSGCEKKYERPDEYKVDLFANEKGNNQAYVMSKDEAFESSAMVLETSDITIYDSLKGRGKDVFLYKVKSGEILKTTRDTVITYPFVFISNQRLKLEKKSQNPIYIYLQTLKGFKFIAEGTNIKYQWLKAAPVYKIEKGNK